MAFDAPTPLPTPGDGPLDMTRESEPSMSLRWLDDRERWSKERQISIGEGGDHFPTKWLNRLGIFRSRQFEFVMASPAIQCIVMVEADDEVLR